MCVCVCVHLRARTKGSTVLLGGFNKTHSMSLNNQEGVVHKDTSNNDWIEVCVAKSRKIIQVHVSNIKLITSSRKSIDASASADAAAPVLESQSASADAAAPVLHAFVYAVSCARVCI